MECETTRRIDSDSVKWPSEFVELEILDTTLKCGICYEYMKIAMITNCSHTYCSLCIRKYLQYSTHCPTCFNLSHESDLRNNRPIDDVISLYLKIKDKLLKALRVAAAASNGIPISTISEVTSELASQKEVTPTRPTTNTPKLSGIKAFMGQKPSQGDTQISRGETPARRGLFEAVSASSPSSSTSTKPSPVLVPRMFTVVRPQQPATDSEPCESVPCPVCSVEIPSRNINKHLDACLSRGSNPQPKPIKKEKKLNPLPRRIFNLLPEKDLRKYMKDYGLSTKGDRNALLTRVKRFTLLYNTEMDMDNQRSVIDIVAQVHREERDESRKGCDNPLFKKLSEKVDRYSKPEDIENANKEHLTEYKDHYRKIIEAMKARRMAKKASVPTCTVDLSNDEEGTADADMHGSLKENLDPVSYNEKPETTSGSLENVRSISPEYSIYDNAIPSTSHASDEDIIPGSPISSSAVDCDGKDSKKQEDCDKSSFFEKTMISEDPKTNCNSWSDNSSDESIFEVPSSQKKKSQRTVVTKGSANNNSPEEDSAPPSIDTENAEPLANREKSEDSSETYVPRHSKRRRDTGYTSDGCVSSEESIAVCRPRRNVKKICSYSP